MRTHALPGGRNPTLSRSTRSGIHARVSKQDGARAALALTPHWSNSFQQEPLMAFTTTQSPFSIHARLNSRGTLNWIAWALVVIGALNWGSIGLFDVNLVALIFSGMPVLGRAAYVLVGIAGLYFLSVPFQGAPDDTE
jgi:uncharacterized membrane protein YuzA (DUF378 family)